MSSLQQWLKISLRYAYLKARQDRYSSKKFERDNLYDAASVMYALIAMLMIVSMYFQKQANRGSTPVLNQSCSPGSDPA
jgi:hypothetical protein